jgi:hypothetical protein
MATPSREISIAYGLYTVTKTDDVHFGFDGPDLSGITFQFEIADPDPTTFAGLKSAAETAFRTPRKDLVISVRGTTWKSFSHASGTGFNANPKIEPLKEGRSANSIIYKVTIDFGRPADVYDTNYRRNSTIKVMWTTDRRMHMEADGVYTCNGSTAARAQYLAQIGAYATDILTALGGNYDLLEEHVVNDDQNKVATFHRKYDEQRTGRNEAQIIVETLPNTRKRVTISGTYSTILAATSSVAAYNSLYPAFKTTVLAAAGGTYQETTTHVEHNDTDLVTTFTNVYDQVIDNRQDASFQIIYATDRRCSVFFYANYFTGTSGTDAFTLAQSDFPAWAAGILGASPLSLLVFNKKSESYQPNDIVPPNFCSARLEFLEAYVSQAGALPHASIRDQNYTVSPTYEGPGDSPGASVTRMVEVIVDYTAMIDKTRLNSPGAIVSLWTAIKNWLLAEVAGVYNRTGGIVVVMSENPSYNPDNSIIVARLKLWIPPAPHLLYRLDISDSVDQGLVFDKLWTGNSMNFHVYEGGTVAIRKAVKTYRFYGLNKSDISPINTDIHNIDADGLTGGGEGEGGLDPFGLEAKQMFVIHRSQPSRVVSEIGVAPNKTTITDVTFTEIIRVIEPVSGSS